ncbi:unnamed protein product [Rotaria sp. Silwood1]|nr:unnamed protein product [Rotaria sp. Silwood1]
MPHWLPKPPGTVASYSDEGSSVAALVVERVSNMSYIDYVKQKILKPLGIDITKVGIRLSDFKNTEDLVKHYSYAFNTSYIQRWQQLLPQLNITQISDNLPTWLYISHYGFGTYPAGLLRMSASTLSIYLRMFLSNGSSILRPQSITEMRTVVGGGLIPFYSQESSSNSTVQQVLSEFGLSWYWQTMKDGRRYIGHSGAIPGMIHLILVNEKNNLGVILLSNADADMDFVSYEMVKIPGEMLDPFLYDFLADVDFVSYEMVKIPGEMVHPFLGYGFFSYEMVIIAGEMS